MNFDSFKAEWVSKRVGDPTLMHVGIPENQIYQCVSLVKQYLREDYGIAAGYWGNAIDYWHNTNPAVLTKFDRIATQDVRKGDIVVLNGLNGSTAGHIGIGTGNSNNSQFELLEQNGQTGGGTGLNGDAIRTRYIAKSRIAGVLRPKPVVVAAAVVVHPYTIQLIDPKQVVINKPTHRWGMNYDNLTAILAHPEGSAAPGEVKTVSAICRHNIGYSYYLEDPKVASGYNVSDCNDTRPAEAKPVTAAKLPAAPGPLTAPSSEQYSVVTSLPGYLTAGQAATHVNSNSTVPPGAYNVYNKFNGMINITRKPGVPGWWINPRDNVQKKPPPSAAATAAAVQPVLSSAVIAPAVMTSPTVVQDPAPDWRITYRPFIDKSGIRTPIKYVALASYDVADLEGRLPDVPLQPGMVVWLGGTFLYENKVQGRPKDAADRFIWYRIPLDENIIAPYDSVYSTKTSTSERQTMKTTKPYDYLIIATEQLTKFWDIITRKNKKVI